MYARDLTRLFEEKILCTQYDLWRFEVSALDIIAIKKTRFGVRLCGFEVKSSRDNAPRIIEQLPRYVMLMDRVFLVLDSGVPVPHLPSWCGVFRFQEGDFKLVHPPGSPDEFRQRRSLWTEAQGAAPFGRLDVEDFMSLLRKWFIWSAFGEKIEEIGDRERRIIEMIGNVRADSLDNWGGPRQA